MVTKLSLALLLVLSVLEVYGMQIQINGDLGLSYGFGDQSILESLDIQEGFNFNQQIQFTLSGEVNDGLYVSANVGTKTTTVTLYYVPLNVQLGNVTTSAYGVNNFSVFGIKIPNASFGQLSGNILNTTVTVSPLVPYATIGSILYGSVVIYSDGQVLNPTLYTIDYTTGTIYFSDLTSTKTFTIEYQSNSSNAGTYLLMTSAGTKDKGYNLNGTFCTVFSTPSDQFFGLGEINNDKFSLQGAVNVDQIPSFKVGLTEHDFFFGQDVKMALSYVSEGFRYPLGIAQVPGIGGNVSIGPVSFSFNKDYFGVTENGSSINSSLEIGTQNGINASVRWKNFETALSISASNVTAFESFSNDVFNLMVGQNFSNSTNWCVLQIATPISAEASVSSQGFGVSLSKLMGPALLNASFSTFQNYNQANLGISNLLAYGIPLSGNIQISNSSTSSIMGNLSFSMPAGKIGLSATTFPSFGLSFSNNTWNLNGQIWNNGWNLTAGVQMNFSNFTLDGNLEFENDQNRFGGSISLNLSGQI